MPFSTIALSNHRFESLPFHTIGTSDRRHGGLSLGMCVVVLARGAPQSHSEDVAFLVNGLSVLIGSCWCRAALAFRTESTAEGQIHPTQAAGRFA